MLDTPRQDIDVARPQDQRGGRIEDWLASGRFAASLDEAAIVALTDTAGTIVYCNERFCEVSGYSRQALIGANHRIIQSGAHDRDFFRRMYRAIGAGETWRGTLCNRRKSGELYWVDTTIVPQLGPDRRPAYYLAIRFDVTAHVLALEALAEARRKAESAAIAKERFLAQMSHELRTPLTGVMGLAELLANTQLTPLQNGYVRNIFEASQTLHTIVDDILHFAQTRADQVSLVRKETRVREVVDRVMALVAVRAAAKGLSLRAEIADDLPESLMTDPFRLGQILTNLVGNAVKFTDQGSVTLRAAWRDGRLACAVEDTGVSFDHSDKERLFRPFEQAPDAEGRHVGGTGLGLPIAAGLVAALGGALDAEPRPDGGARFYFDIPCPVAGAASGQSAAASAPARLAPSLVPRSVLVVEDNRINQQIVQKVLEAAGHEVMVTSDGAEGLAALRSRPFDVCLMDLRMPGMDGWAAAAEVRSDGAARVRETPILALSADILEGQSGQLAEAGFDDFLAKPINIAGLLSAVERWGARLHSDAPDDLQSMIA